MGLLEFPVRICDVLHTTTLETYLIYPMIAISSYHCMPLCLHVRLRNALPTSWSICLSSMGIIMNFSEMCFIIIDLVTSTSHRKVPSKAPHSTGLSRTSSKSQDLDFLSHNYCEQNKTAHSEIYQRHCHVQNLKLHLLPQAHHNFEINLIWVFDLHGTQTTDKWWQQNHSTEWDCLKTKVRFSDALLVSHRIKQRMTR